MPTTANADATEQLTRPDDSRPVGDDRWSPVADGGARAGRGQYDRRLNAWGLWSLMPDDIEENLEKRVCVICGHEQAEAGDCLDVRTRRPADTEGMPTRATQ